LRALTDPTAILNHHFKHYSNFSNIYPILVPAMIKYVNDIEMRLIISTLFQKWQMKHIMQNVGERHLHCNQEHTHNHYCSVVLSLWICEMLSTVYRESFGQYKSRFSVKGYTQKNAYEFFFTQFFPADAREALEICMICCVRERTRVCPGLIRRLGRSA
jgi:hypothetical protein